VDVRELDEQEAQQRFALARVARLATLGPRKQPHLVPITFVLGSGPDGRAALSFAIDDAKPKSTHQLQRLENIARSPKVSVLVDRYDDDWSLLWWVRADGAARILESGRTYEAALRGLAGKYPQYVEQPPAGPVVVIDVDQWRSWEADPDAGAPVS
jgi:PPOX class probable F420-dependent enzyme